MVELTTIPGSVEDVLSNEKVSFEDAMTSTGFGKFNYISMIYCGFMLLGMILETLGFSYIIPASQCDLELTLTQKTWLPVIPFVAIIVTSHMWGYLADTRGRKKILAVCMSVGCCISIASSFSPDLISFAIMRLIAGLFTSGPSALGYAYLGELNPLSHRDKMLTLGNSFVAIGSAVVPLMAWTVLPLDFRFDLSYIEYRPWRLLICLLALPYVICAMFIVKFPESPKFLFNQGKVNESLDVLRYIYSQNTGKAPEHFPVKRVKSEDNSQSQKRSFFKDVWHQTAPLFNAEYRLYTLITSLLQFGIFSVTNGFYIWFPAVLNTILDHREAGTNIGKNICTMLAEENALKITNSTSISSIADGDFDASQCKDILNTNTFVISILLASFVSMVTITCAFLINTLGKKNLIVGVFVLVGTCCLVLHWLTETWSSIIIFALIQVSGSAIGLVNAYVVEIFPTHVRAMAVCLTLMMGRVGSMFGTNLIGYLMNSTCPVSFFLFAGVCYFCLGLSFTLPNSSSKTKPKVYPKDAKGLENDIQL